MYLELSKTQLAFVKETISESSNTLKRWTDRLPRNKRRDFRASIFREQPDFALFPGEEKKLRSDADKIMVLKKKKFEEVGGRTIEETLIEAYFPLFRKWCRGNDDALSAFIVEALQAIYSFTKPSKSLVEYLKTTFNNFIGEFTHSAMNIIHKPVRWGSLGKKFDSIRLQNPSLSEDEVIELMQVTSEEKGFVKSRNKFPNVWSIEKVGKNEDDSYEVTVCRPKPERYESELVALRDMDMSSIGLTELQKACVSAYSSHSQWHSHVPKSLIGLEPKNRREFTSICNAELEEALYIIQGHLEEAI